ncbi:MAG: helix-turn-helix domain-containing protein [Betaproteobacteria bacterium]|nr:helix-turn-helix domain-containing protein [Betaproteobacteria bacterium]
MHPDTLTLDDAADMLKTTPDTVAECIHHRGLPAAKVGRAWVLVREDVIAWLRTQYARKDNTACDSTAAPALTSGTPTSSAQTANALAKALAPETSRRRRNGPPKLRTIAGGREN